MPEWRLFFNLAGKVDNVLFLGKGGKCINDVKRFDFHMIQSACPDVIILMTGENDVGFFVCVCFLGGWHRLRGLSNITQ